MKDEKLWKVFSLYIRLRDSKDGYGSCITCGRIIHYLKGDCGHGIGRQHKATKYDEKNNHLQCKPCNGFHGGKREIYKQQVDIKYGPGTWDLLELKSKQVCKWGQFEINALHDYYKNKIKNLK